MSRTRENLWAGDPLFALRFSLLDGCSIGTASNRQPSSEERTARSGTGSESRFLYDPPVQHTNRHVLDSIEFRRLVAGRWRVSLALTTLLFVLYYGYILLIATNRELVSQPVSGATTTGILIATGVIVGAWVLTAAYVVWANRQYDPAVAELRARAEKSHG
jgi:uncharacterized membrane protein (DUF485 family)